MRKYNRSGTGICFMIFMVLVLLIVISPVKADTAEGDGESSEKILIKAGKLHYLDDRYEGTGGVTFIKGDTEVTGEQGVLYEAENRADLTGGVFLEHDKGEIKAARLSAWLKEDRYLFKEEVSLLQKLEDGDFSLEAPELEVMLDTDSFKATQGAIVRYNNRTLKGDTVIYNDQEQTLELTDNVLIEEEDGDWIKCARALFYLETEEFIAEGSIELELEI